MIGETSLAAAELLQSYNQQLNTIIIYCKHY